MFVNLFDCFWTNKQNLKGQFGLCFVYHLSVAFCLKTHVSLKLKQAPHMLLIQLLSRTHPVVSETSCGYFWSDVKLCAPNFLSLTVAVSLLHQRHRGPHRTETLKLHVVTNPIEGENIPLRLSAHSDTNTELSGI